jgi:hypothetical protein
MREVTVGAPSTQWWVHLSTAIVFGLGFATVLTLIVTPAALLLIERMAEWRRRNIARLRTTSLRAWLRGWPRAMLRRFTPKWSR